MLHLVCYDLPADAAGNKRRRKILRILEGYGDRVQYSVFELRLKKPAELRELKGRLEQVISAKEDSIRIYPLHADIEQEIIILGQGKIFEIDETVVI